MQHDWLPQFCKANFIFSAMVVAEVVVLVSALTDQPSGGFWRQIGISTLFTQWVVITAAAALCSLQPMLRKLPAVAGIGIAYVMVLAIAATASSIGYWLDGAFRLDLIDPSRSHRSLVTVNTLICAVVSALAGRYFYVQRQWQAQIRSQAEAKVQALQARIRPHFLFNSMNLVASLVRRRPQQAEAVVEDLSDLFRAALRDLDDDSTLAQELDLVRSYLAIEQLRLGERMKVNWNTDSLPLHTPLPPLLIQPLVENAVYHGLQQRPEGGVIEIVGSSQADRWMLTITNPRPVQKTEAGSGMAIDNIRQRLALRFGRKASLETVGEPDRFTATMTIPVPESIKETA